MLSQSSKRAAKSLAWAAMESTMLRNSRFPVGLMVGAHPYMMLRLIPNDIFDGLKC
jgi:hypothetical protein